MELRSKLKPDYLRHCQFNNFETLRGKTSLCTDSVLQSSRVPDNDIVPKTTIKVEKIGLQWRASFTRGVWRQFSDRATRAVIPEFKYS